MQVARWLEEELDTAGLSAGLKTSGKRGIHAYVPLPAGTPNDAGRLVAEILARRVAHAHPKLTTVRRAVKERPAGTVYLDYMQNVVGKSVAAAFSVRARDVPALSAPLDWNELSGDLDPLDFTIAISDAELAKRGRMWTDSMKRRNSLERLLAERVGGRSRG
jgi:bifunctional non-homologous end joining protein LigD